MKNYQPTINQINKLYITERKSYLVLSKNGEYSTLTKGKNTPVALNDNLLRQHLKGQKTIGVFSGTQYSKFICFDLDMIDKTKTKWLTENVINSLLELGFNYNDIHLASSGNKGIHVLLFSNNPIPLLNFKSLFIYTMQTLQNNISTDIKTTIHKGNELVLEINDIANIEFRPSNSQGVKIELGLNFRSKNRDNKCLFIDKDTFELIEDMNYFLNIQPIDSDVITMIVEENDESEIDEDIIEEGKELVKSNIKESYAHKLNRDEDETIEHIKDLLLNGMTTSGSRNNSVFKIARYFAYLGLELDDAIIELKEWMMNQDTKYYTSTLEFALSECERICKNVYDKGYTLVGDIENLHIYKDEMLEIMKIKEKNAKLILFTMLLHSKRYSTSNGVFYMTYKQVEEMCGLKISATKNNIDILENLGLIEVVSRDVKQSGTYIKRPNKYKININTDSLESILEIDNSNTVIDYTDLYFKSIVNTFTNKELKSIIPDKQYREVYNYRKLIS